MKHFRVVSVSKHISNAVMQHTGENFLHAMKLRTSQFLLCALAITLVLQLIAGEFFLSPGVPHSQAKVESRKNVHFFHVLFSEKAENEVENGGDDDLHTRPLLADFASFTDAIPFAGILTDRSFFEYKNFIISPPLYRLNCALLI